MDVESIRRAVRAHLATVAPDSAGQEIEPDRPLRQQIELDSMDWINLMAGLEDHLQVEIPESDHSRLTTLDAMAAYLASRLAAQAPGPPRPTPRPFEALPRTVELANGTTVRLRPISAEDAPLEADFFRRLSADSRYKRFMGTLRELPPAKLKYLTEVDSDHHVALVATMDRAGQESMLGAARYIVDASGTGCEFAVAIDDAWQGSGLAGVLMQALMDVARARHLSTMEGTVLASNVRMLKFMRQLGFRLRRDPADAHNVLVARSL